MNLNDTNTLIIVGLAAGALVVLLVGGALATRVKRRKLDVNKFQTRWQALQQQCVKSELWPLAIIDADKLLDEALKQLHFKGKTMGERLVAAQRELSNNDAVWFGHKLRNKIVHEEMKRLYKRDVQAALRGFRQALKDLGALR